MLISEEYLFLCGSLEILNFEFISRFSQNAYANLQRGQVTGLGLKPDEMAAIKAGGKSVQELTGKFYCWIFTMCKCIKYLLELSMIYLHPWIIHTQKCHYVPLYNRCHSLQNQISKDIQ